MKKLGSAILYYLMKVTEQMNFYERVINFLGF